MGDFMGERFYAEAGFSVAGNKWFGRRVSACKELSGMRRKK
ncbi:hypothetical protein CHISP_1772 [Chitinispirillum alkaliphilum]|nr:hypothetical protein CHISP_1772 [Chitinispirillum alkaliphilum]